MEMVVRCGPETKPGDVICYVECTAGQREGFDDPRRVLTPYGVYKVVGVVAEPWRTRLTLDSWPGLEFNSVSFAPVVE